jgi:hypothetical protein
MFKKVIIMITNLKLNLSIKKAQSVLEQPFDAAEIAPIVVKVLSSNPIYNNV